LKKMQSAEVDRKAQGVGCHSHAAVT